MNTHRLHATFSRRNAAPFTLFCLLIVVALFGLAQSSATAGGGSGQRPPFMSDEEMKKQFNDDDLKTKGDKPAGKWTYATLLDSKLDDPSAPACVRGIELLSGGGKYLGIHKIKRVQVENRSSKTIVSVQVRVELVEFNEPGKTLLKDVFPFANASIAPNASEVVEIKTIVPPRLFKALAKDGVLDGDFGIRISVQEVQFADGSLWREPEPVALLKPPYLDQSLVLRFPDLASLATFLPPPLRSSDAKRADMAQCTTKPRLAASAFSSLPFEYDTCTNNSGPRIDEMGRKSCGAPGFRTCYAHCSDDGWCSTWQSDIPCGSPTATPPTGTCEWPPPHPCCTPEMVTLSSTSIQHCRWKCKPGESDCTTGTVFANGCYSVPGPTVCPEDNYEFTTKDGYGPLCCPAAPTPTPAGGGCDGPAGSQTGDDGGSGSVGCNSPVLIDVAGDGFALTDAAGGVRFDLNGDGAAERLGWTEEGSDDAWLALDRDGDGRITRGSELFGNFTEQPLPPAGQWRNGFLALAVYDAPGRGGDGDGAISTGDPVFARLRLWRDANHDGLSQPSELHALRSLDVVRIRLDYKESKRADGHGNRFRYRAKVDDAKGAKAGRWAWDVFLVSAP